MRWRKKYPTPMDYKQQSRFVGALLLILLMLWLTASRLDYEDALVQEQINLDKAQALQLACLEQAHRSERGEQVHVGWVVDGQLISVDCSVISREAYKNVKRRMM